MAFSRRGIDQALILALCNHRNVCRPHSSYIKHTDPDLASGFHLELELPLTGITQLEESVGPPSFSASCGESDQDASISSYLGDYFASQIALHQLCAKFHGCDSDCMCIAASSMIRRQTRASHEPVLNDSDHFTHTLKFMGPIASTWKTLYFQLIQWREVLPEALKWPEDDHTGSRTRGYSTCSSKSLSNIH